MTRTELKIKIRRVERSIRNDRLCLAKNNPCASSSVKNQYLWFLLPLGTFILGFRRDTAVIGAVYTVARSFAFKWVKANAIKTLSKFLIKM